MGLLVWTQTRDDHWMLGTTEPHHRYTIHRLGNVYHINRTVGGTFTCEIGLVNFKEMQAVVETMVRLGV